MLSGGNLFFLELLHIWNTELLEGTEQHDVTQNTILTDYTLSLLEFN